MKLFTPEKINTEATKQENLLNYRIEYLKREEKKMLAKIAERRKEYEGIKDSDSEKITDKKSQLLKELHQIEVELEKKKDLFYGLTERQDELDEREAEIVKKEENLRLREQYVKQVEHKIVEMSYGR